MFFFIEWTGFSRVREGWALEEENGWRVEGRGGKVACMEVYAICNAI
jgi:hypothetical protein